jgi:hypothetical protein
MFDLQTVFLLVTVFLGTVISDAVLFGRSFRVQLSVPPTLVQRGLTNDAAEHLFTTELDKLDRVTTVLGVPTMGIVAKPTLLSAIGSLARADAIVEVVQERIGMQTVSIKGVIVSQQQGPQLDMYVMVSVPVGADIKIEVAQPDGDAPALIERTARKLSEQIAPYRTALLTYIDGRDSDPQSVEQARLVAEAALARPWTSQQALERFLLNNLLAIIALHDGDRAKADQYLEASLYVPSVGKAAHALTALNRAVLAIADRKPAEAAEFLKEAHSMITETRAIKPHVEVVVALQAWSEGNLVEAERLLRDSTTILESNRDAHLYLARLYDQLGRTADAARERLLAREARDHAAEAPALISSEFWVDPVRGGLALRR